MLNNSTRLNKIREERSHSISNNEDEAVILGNALHIEKAQKLLFRDLLNDTKASLQELNVRFALGGTNTGNEVPFLFAKWKA